VTRLWANVVGIALIAAPSFIFGQQAAPNDAANGKRLFVQNGCFQCHGYVGQGGASGPRIAPWTFGSEGLISYVRHPAGQMPLYTEKVLPTSDLMAIWAYLKSIPAPKAAKDIPLLNNAQSK
jgi:ubiquinol-cytochrome c reductase cytochrome c subunit